MNGCKDIRGQLGRYLDGEMHADVRAVLEVHLGECPSCQNELSSLRTVIAALTHGPPIEVSAALWPAIEKRLNDSARPSSGVSQLRRPRLLQGPWAAVATIGVAAALMLAVLSQWSTPARASAIDFSVLLDTLPLDASGAFQKFLARHDGAPIAAEEARRRAAALNFAIPEELPGGFVRREVYLLRFGDHPGVAAVYDRAGEFLAAIFHRPVAQEDFGSHKDYPCVVGKHRGHKVRVGEWQLVHVTDPTTCHCVLSRLDEEGELPAILSAVAPGFESPPKDHSHP
jgi:hypothetical protein